MRLFYDSKSSSFGYFLCLVPLLAIFFLTSAMPENIDFYVIHSKEGHFKPSPEDPSMGTLKFLNVSDSVLYFAQRKNKEAGAMSLEAFLQHWQGKDAKAHTAAGLVSYEKKGTQYQEFSVNLLNPQYDKRNRILTFDLYSTSQENTLPIHMLEPSIFVKGSNWTTSLSE